MLNQNLFDFNYLALRLLNFFIIIFQYAYYAIQSYQAINFQIR